MTKTRKINKREQERRDTIKVMLFVALITLLMGISIGYYIWGPKTTECSWSMCGCDYSYNNHYVCNVHGHDCLN